MFRRNSCVPRSCLVCRDLVVWLFIAVGNYSGHRQEGRRLRPSLDADFERLECQESSRSFRLRFDACKSRSWRPLEWLRMDGQLPALLLFRPCRGKATVLQGSSMRSKRQSGTRPSSVWHRIRGLCARGLVRIALGRSWLRVSSEFGPLLIKPPFNRLDLRADVLNPFLFLVDPTLDPSPKPLAPC